MTKRFRVSLFPAALAVLVVVFLAGCAGFDLESFITELENSADAENISSDDGPIADGQGSSSVEVSGFGDRGTPFPERLPVTIESSRRVATTPLEPGFRPNDLSFLDETTGYVVGPDGAIARTRDGGESWVRLETSITTSIEAVDFLNERVGVVAGASAAVGLTFDGGESWQVYSFLDEPREVPDGTYWLDMTDPSVLARRNLRSAHAHDADTFIVAGEYGLVYRTTDGGRSWEDISIVSPQTMYGIDTTADGTIFVAGGMGLADNTNVLRSVDGGRSWRELHGDLGNPAGGISVAETGRIIVTGAAFFFADEFGDRLRRLPDLLGAMVWEGTVGYWGAAEIDEHGAWILQGSGFSDDGRGVSVLSSVDAGESWTLIEGGTYATVRAGRVVADGFAYALLQQAGQWEAELHRLDW